MNINYINEERYFYMDDEDDSDINKEDLYSIVNDQNLEDDDVQELYFDDRY